MGARLKAAKKMFSWHFVGSHLFKGALQGLGAIAIYVLVAVIVIRTGKADGVMKSAMTLKNPAMARESGL
jgi:hypothetical protein